MKDEIVTKAVLNALAIHNDRIWGLRDEVLRLNNYVTILALANIFIYWELMDAKHPGWERKLTEKVKELVEKGRKVEKNEG